MPTLTLATVAQLGVAWWILRGAGAGAVRSSARAAPRPRPAVIPGGRIAFPVGNNGAATDDTVTVVPPIPEDGSRDASSRDRGGRTRMTPPLIEPVPVDPDRATGDTQMAGIFSWFTNTTDSIILQWREKLAEWHAAREQFETNRETARGLIRLAKQVDLKARQSGATPGQLAPLRIARLRIEGILAADQSRANQVAMVDGLIQRAIAAGAPANGLGVIQLIPIAAIGAALAAIVVAVAWMRTHSQTVAFETKKLAAIVTGLLTDEELKALAETGSPLSIGETLGQFGKLALGAAVLVGVLLYAKGRAA